MKIYVSFVVFQYDFVLFFFCFIGNIERNKNSKLVCFTAAFLGYLNIWKESFFWEEESEVLKTSMWIKIGSLFIFQIESTIFLKHCFGKNFSSFAASSFPINNVHILLTLILSGRRLWCAAAAAEQIGFPIQHWQVLSCHSRAVHSTLFNALCTFTFSLFAFLTLIFGFSPILFLFFFCIVCCKKKKLFFSHFDNTNPRFSFGNSNILFRIFYIDVHKLEMKKKKKNP